MPIRRSTPEETEAFWGGGLIVFSSNLRADFLAHKKRAEERKAAEEALRLQAQEAPQKGPKNDR